MSSYGVSVSIITSYREKCYDFFPKRKLPSQRNSSFSLSIYQAIQQYSIDCADENTGDDLHRGVAHKFLQLDLR